MKRSTLALAAAGTVAALALLAWAFAGRPLPVEVAVATQGHFETAIEEDGKTRLRERYVVSTPLAGRLARISLREGDAVQAGAVLARLMPALSALQDERTLASQQAQLEMAQATLQRAEARLGVARVGRLQAAHEALRSEQLAQQGFLSPMRLESDRLALASAEQEQQAADSDRRVALHGVEQARAAIAVVRAPTAEGSRVFELRAPVDGSVLRVLQASEATVAAGTPLIELGDTSQLEIVAELLTSDALQARPGAPVLIDRWGGEEPLAGRVRRVEPGGFTMVSALGVEEQRVRVLIELTGDPAQWRALGDGFRVGVRIVTQAVDQAIQVPVSAVFPTAEGMAVFTLQQGRARQQAVQVAARNGRQAWIRSGLAAGTQVIVYPPPGVRAGVRVKVHDAAA
jgi:HlyD family secretion protein